MNIRDATTSDIPEILHIRFAVKENTLSNRALVTHEMCEDYLDKLGHGWVCMLDDEMVGFSYAARNDHSIWALFVKPGFEGMGIGKQLLRVTVQWLFDLGAERVSLSTAINTRADGFYRAQGFRSGEMKNPVEVMFYLDKTAAGDQGYRMTRDSA